MSMNPMGRGNVPSHTSYQQHVQLRHYDTPQGADGTFDAHQGHAFSHMSHEPHQQQCWSEEEDEIYYHPPPQAPRIFTSNPNPIFHPQVTHDAMQQPYACLHNTARHGYYVPHPQTFLPPPLQTANIAFHHGQISPPDDQLSSDFGNPSAPGWEIGHTFAFPSKFDMAHPNFSDHGGDPDELVSPTDPNPNPQLQEAAEPLHSTEEPPRRRGRKRSSRIDTSSMTQEERRESFLERNREAATKCRQKKKERDDAMEKKKAVLQVHNRSLKEEFESLRAQLTSLKAQALEHCERSACNTGDLQKWLGDHMKRASAAAKIQVPVVVEDEDEDDEEEEHEEHDDLEDDESP